MVEVDGELVAHVGLLELPLRGRAGRRLPAPVRRGGGGARSAAPGRFDPLDAGLAPRWRGERWPCPRWCGSASRDLAARIPGAELVTLAGAGHLANLDQPDAFDRSLGDFLDRHATRASTVG